MHIKDRFTTPRASLVAALLIPSLLTLLLLWLPFGFGVTGHIEEWDLLGLFNTVGPLPLALPDGPLALHAARPLMPLMFYVSYLLSPDSFVGWHVVLIAALLVKGASSAFLAWRATGSRGWAAFFGPLVILYPADTMQLSFRALHINWAIALALLAGAVLLYATGRTYRGDRFRWAALAAVLYFLGACMYEATLTLVLLPLLIVAARQGIAGLGRLLRYNVGPIVLAWCGLLGYIVYAAVAGSRGNNYQSSITGGGHNLVALLTESLPKLFTIGYTRALLGGWIDAFGIIASEFAGYAYLGGAALVLAAIIGGLAYVSRNSVVDEAATSPATGWRLLLAGLLACGMGYAPFLLLPTHQVFSQRTYLWASPGAALAWLAVLLLLSRLHKWLAPAAAVVLIGAGVGAQLFQFHHYANISETQQAVLRAITENYDGGGNGKNLLIRDESNTLGQTWAMLPGGLEMALSYLYGHGVPAVQVCHFPSGEWQHGDGLGRKGTCTREADGGWVLAEAATMAGPGYVAAPRRPDVRMAADTTIVVTIHPDFTGSVDSGAAKPEPAPTAQFGTLGRRYRGALGTRTSTQWMLFNDQLPAHAYRWSFGNWWSMDIPARSSGWREAEWNAEGLFTHRSVSWKTADTATLDFTLDPYPGMYRLRGQFMAFAGDAARNGLVVMINRHPVSMKLTDQGTFAADVPAAWLRKGVNEFAVSAPVNQEYYGLSVQLDWFDLQPR